MTADRTIANRMAMNRTAANETVRNSHREGAVTTSRAGALGRLWSNNFSRTATDQNRTTTSGTATNKTIAEGFKDSRRDKRQESAIAKQRPMADRARTSSAAMLGRVTALAETSHERLQKKRL